MLRKPDAASGLTARTPDVFFDLGFRFAQLVHGAVSHLTPIRETHFERGTTDRLVDRVEVRLQLLGGERHVNFVRTSYEVVSTDRYLAPLVLK